MSVAPQKRYSALDILELLERAEALGVSLDRGSELETMTIQELERLVNVRM